MKKSVYKKEKHRLKRLVENELDRAYYENCIADSLMRIEEKGGFFHCKECVFIDDEGIFMCSNRFGLLKKEVV